MPVSKIPPSYHLKQMIKSDDVSKAVEHYFAFWRHMYNIQFFTLKEYQKVFGIN